MSTIYVSGEHHARTYPHTCICSRGAKIPEMNTRGNFTRDESIMMFEGTLIGIAANSIPMAAKH